MFKFQAIKRDLLIICLNVKTLSIMKQDKGIGLVIMVKTKLRYGEMFSIIVNKAIPNTQFGPYKINRIKNA